MAVRHAAASPRRFTISTPSAAPSPPSTAPASTELKLTPAIREAVNTALERGRMLSFAYVDPQGRPQLSFRGSLQTYGDRQLAIWVRNPEGGLLAAVRAGHVHVTAMFGQLAPSKAFITFRGRAHVDNSAAVRRAVWQSTPKLEQDLDKAQKGVPLIVDLDSVDGVLEGQVLRMRR